MSAKQKVRATVTIELEVPDDVDASDVIHDVWGMGDPDDEYNACIVVDETEIVRRFSWQAPPLSWQAPPPEPADGSKA